jgi:hypothetical protein
LPITKGSTANRRLGMDPVTITKPKCRKPWRF